MKFTIIGRKCTPHSSFKKRAENKLKKVEKFFSDESKAKITAKVEKNKKIVEITVKSKDLIFRAENTADNLEEALDNCVDLLIRQIRKNKTKIQKRLKLNKLDEFFLSLGEDEFEEFDYDIVRTKTVDLKPQSVDEAILQMNMLGHIFYVFLNELTNKVNVVYSRNDGGYGVIEPNI